MRLAPLRLLCAKADHTTSPQVDNGPQLFDQLFGVIHPTSQGKLASYGKLVSLSPTWPFGELVPLRICVFVLLFTAFSPFMGSWPHFFFTRRFGWGYLHKDGVHLVQSNHIFFRSEKISTQ